MGVCEVASRTALEVLDKHAIVVSSISKIISEPSNLEGKCNACMTHLRSLRKADQQSLMI